jgi:hypothetical protein
MSKSGLILVKPARDLSPLTPGVLYEVAAAKYVKIDIMDFRELVRSGIIPSRSHYGRTRKIYLKEDLDRYLRNLPINSAVGSRIGNGEVSSKPPALQEVNIGS